MLDVVLHAASAVLVLVCVAGLGYWGGYRGKFDAKSGQLISKIVNMSLPFFLFYSVASKFDHEQLMELLKLAYLPFITIGINFLISLAIIKLGWVRKELMGVFVACFSGATVMFVGVPMGMAMWGEISIPYLLIYFVANCLYVWTVGLYCVQWDGVQRHGGAAPRVVSMKSIKMLFNGPLIGFLVGLAVVFLSIPVPKTIMMTTHIIGQMATPLALVFIGITIYLVGFAKLKHMPREVWFILFSCFILRPLVMYLCSMPLEMDRLMRQVFILASALPVTSIYAVMARHHGADEEFVSEAVGMTTVGLLFVMPVLLVLVSFI